MQNSWISTVLFRHFLAVWFCFALGLFSYSSISYEFIIMGFLPSIALPSKDTIKKRCTTLEAWALPKQDSTIAPDYVWTNKDMDPVPIEDQTWSMWTWVA